MSKASDVFNRLTTSKELQIPDNIRKNAKCIAVVPEVVQAAFIAGGKFGHGVVTCKKEDNSWSTPAFISLGGASVGFQAGVDRADVVLFFMNDAARRALASRSLTLGGDIGVSAGPVGRATSGSTNLEMTGILSYSISQGLFAGMSFQGGVFSPDDRANTDYYGQKLSMDQLLFGNSISLAPVEAEKFLESVSTDSSLGNTVL
jgi:lipid-binding SYLF domain-containing protein